MNWFANHRQEWIAQMLKVYGHINRQHLMRNFDISGAQAVLDLRAFNEQNPDVMRYCNRQKTYIAAVPPKFMPGIEQ